MLQTINDFYLSTGFAAITYQQVIMIGISFLLLFLAIKKGFEPLLLIPIAFGMFLTNLPLAGLMAHPEYAADGTLKNVGGLLYYIYQGNKLGIFPPLIFLGVGAMKICILKFPGCWSAVKRRTEPTPSSPSTALKKSKAPGSCGEK